MTNPEEAPSVDTHLSSKRPSWATALVLCVICSVVAGALGYFVALQRGNVGAHAHAAAIEMYQCPMHPTIIQDHAGNCPICGMKLVKVTSPAPTTGQPSNTPATASEHNVLFYRSPMDPKQTSPTPRKDEMGMDYVPVYAEDIGNNEPAIEGLAMVDIDLSRQQLIGLRTADVTRSKIGGAWRTVGRVVVDETRVYHVNVKVGGFVERIYVDFVGKQVSRGAPLFSLYSPELLAAQDEYLLALRTRGILSAPETSPSSETDALVKAARRKLELWDVPSTTLDKMAQSHQTTKTITLSSPVSGVVTKKDVVQGMKLDAGAMPYEIVDLSRVWVVADVYESELRMVKMGMQATLTLNAYPNREFVGKVVFVDPMLDPSTRTVKVRLTFPNPTRELRPEMFGEVVLKGSPHDALTIPEDAVIDSGTSHVVFVSLGNGKFKPRAVQTGDSDGNQVEIVSGLNQGEKVVTRANFLIDSESRLRASLAELTGSGRQAATESARVLPATDGSAARTPASAPVPVQDRASALTTGTQRQPRVQSSPVSGEHEHGARGP